MTDREYESPKQQHWASVAGRLAGWLHAVRLTEPTNSYTFPPPPLGFSLPPVIHDASQASGKGLLMLLFSDGQAGQSCVREGGRAGGVTNKSEVQRVAVSSGCGPLPF